MRQPGRQCAESQQPLTLADGFLGVLDAEEEALQQVHRHREPVGHQLRESGGIEHEEPRGLGHTHRVVVHLGNAVPEVGVERAGIDAGARRPARLDVVGANLAGQHDRAGEQYVQRRRRVAFGVDTARLGDDDAPFAAQPGELVVCQLLEQEQAPQLLGAAPGIGARDFGARRRRARQRSTGCRVGTHSFSR